MPAGHYWILHKKGIIHETKNETVSVFRRAPTRSEGSTRIAPTYAGTTLGIDCSAPVGEAGDTTIRPKCLTLVKHLILILL